jgi:hypothetical protein
MDTGKLEAIGEVFESQYSRNIGKWTKCQWSKKIGTLGLIDLKNRTALEIRDLVTGARTRIEQLLHTLSVEGYQHRLVMSLADAAEWERYGAEAEAYLQDVEWRANEIEVVASKLLESLVEGELDEVANAAAEILRLESVRPSGKFVWKKFGHDVQEFVRALQSGWTPRWLIRLDERQEILGNRAEEDRSAHVYTAHEWNRREEGLDSPRSWTRKATDAQTQWLFKGTPWAAEGEAI